jgi:small neutral amino acid transporter SnatA (MarC family)
VIGLGEVFTLFFVTLGPLKLLGPFVQRTRGLDDATLRRIALHVFVIATIAMIGGCLIGRAMLENWRVSLAALRLTGGIVFFMVALRQLLEQYTPAPAVTPEPLPASPAHAAARLVFPMVLTPYGIAAAIALLASSPSTERTAALLGLIVAVLLLDLLAMLFARRILVGFTILALQVIGAVLAVLQVALSVQFIIGGLRMLGVLAPEAAPLP